MGDLQRSDKEEDELCNNKKQLLSARKRRGRRQGSEGRQRGLGGSLRSEEQQNNVLSPVWVGGRCYGEHYNACLMAHEGGRVGALHKSIS